MTDVVEIQRLLPAAEFCASLKDNTVTTVTLTALCLGASSLGASMAVTGAWLELGLSLVLADTCTPTMVLLVLPSRVGGPLSTGLELVEGTNPELPLQLQKEVTDSD